MSQTLELPEAVYHRLLDAARARGLSPVDWIAEQLPKRVSTPPDASQEARRIARERLWSHLITLDEPTGIDNEGIDADLAREYGDDHKPR